MDFNRIHSLPLHLANQIAAGEVVERPASVLKELIENSLDAGATQIDIHLAGAGKELIQVRDNGIGIHRDDMLLALSRHATSKLQSSEQLSHISSLGFRGEALPSIASVSRLTLTSRQQQSNHAWMVTSDSQDLHPASHPVGTTVTIAELFFNLPARRRFLRSDKTETHHLTTTLHRLALSRFNVGFNCDWGNQQSLQLPALAATKQYPQRLQKICGKAFLNASLYLQQQYDNISLSGWISNTQAHRAQTDIQYFFINGRIIRDRVINHAVREAYGELLPAGRQAAYVLYLELPLDKVDVNVHPTKHEVRFHDARLIHGLITQAIADALSGQPTNTALTPEPPRIVNNINEIRKPYRAALPKPTVARSGHFQQTSVHSAQQWYGNWQLLHQRYALINTNPPRLIDLGLAGQWQKQQQFKSAISRQKLASRPVLVPLWFELPDETLQLVKQQQPLLEQFAISLTIADGQVSISCIPYLLAQVELQTLLQHICHVLQSANNIEQALTDSLLKLIPQSAISSTLQAQQILDGLSEAQLDNAPFCRTLDATILSGLFSS